MFYQLSKLLRKKWCFKFWLPGDCNSDKEGKSPGSPLPFSLPEPPQFCIQTCSDGRGLERISPLFPSPELNPDSGSHRLRDLGTAVLPSLGSCPEKDEDRQRLRPTHTGGWSSEVLCTLSNSTWHTVDMHQLTATLFSFSIRATFFWLLTLSLLVS